MLGRENADFSFAGLKTAVRHAIRSQPGISPADVAASFQQSVIEIVVDRTRFAFVRYRADHPDHTPRFVVAGGVAANAALRSALASLCAAEGFAITVPPVSLCT